MEFAEEMHETEGLSVEADVPMPRKSLQPNVMTAFSVEKRGPTPGRQGYRAKFELLDNKSNLELALNRLGAAAGILCEYFQYSSLKQYANSMVYIEQDRLCVSYAARPKFVQNQCCLGGLTKKSNSALKQPVCL